MAYALLFHSVIMQHAGTSHRLKASSTQHVTPHGNKLLILEIPAVIDTPLIFLDPCGIFDYFVSFKSKLIMHYRTNTITNVIL